MLSRTLRRVLCETGSPLPPTFLLPWTASLSTVSPSASTHTANEGLPPPPSGTAKSTEASSSSLLRLQEQLERTALSATASPARKTTKAPRPSSASDPLKLSRSMRELLPIMQSQGPHYITAHIHGNPYLLTQGDTVRLPFYMHGVEPGDVIRLNRAVNLGSRDYTLKAPAAEPQLKSPTKRTGKFSYIDDRLYECRAVVMGVESEPLRIKEKTKRRQRHTRTVKSKHRFTIIRIKEVRIKGVDEIEGRSI
ncbi:uncharacterized protein SEPMUDRAFT_32485 [Sphaerulina musiva SO2202]|uniref:Large ribosomal subunit protein bL21m n=1 Tax=Sphaerulina musiva (strain SO2202) TaxID=692275 RepID=N1QK10_SPHMS|nr:uncharacterized protein SEPMUDRAFT_32485 [Sphaerulina musiva SO2202]EMF16612.1 hypothetical protein SEPMUDRAFT_32485 [Sphaerulina musiva SO2202]